MDCKYGAENCGSEQRSKNSFHRGITPAICVVSLTLDSPFNVRMGTRRRQGASGSCKSAGPLPKIYRLAAGKRTAATA
jgi:hypothetical protein